MAQRRIQKRVYTSSNNNKEVYDNKDVQPLTAPQGDPSALAASEKYGDVSNIDDTLGGYEKPHSEPEESSTEPESASRPEDTTEKIKTAEEGAASGSGFYSKGEAKESALFNNGAAAGGASALGAAAEGGKGGKAVDRLKMFMGQRRNQVGVGGIGGVLGLILFLAFFGTSFEAVHIRENMLGKGNAAVNQALEHRRNHNFYKLVRRVNADATVKKVNKAKLAPKLHQQGFTTDFRDGKLSSLSFTGSVDGKPVTKTISMNSPDLKGEMSNFFDKTEFGRQASRSLDAAVGGKAATWKGSAARKLYGRMGLKFAPNWLNRKASDKAKDDRAKFADKLRHGTVDSGGGGGTRIAGASDESLKDPNAPPDTTTTVTDPAAGIEGAQEYRDNLLNDPNNSGGVVNGVDGSVTDAVDQDGGDITKTAARTGGVIGKTVLKGLSLTGAQQTACNINGVLKFTANLRNVLVAAELARFAFLSYSAADGEKAGIVNSSGMRLYMLYLNTPNPATGKNATQSGGMQNLVFGNKAARPSPANVAKYGQGRGAQGILGNASKLVNNALKPFGGVKGCRVVNNGFVQVGALAAGVAVAIATFGSSAGAEIAAGLPMAIAGQVAIEVSTIMMVRSASGMTLTGYENGEQAGDALASGYSSSRGMVANSMGMRPAKVTTVNALLQDYEVSETIALKNQSLFERYLSPSNGNSVLVRNVAMAASSTNINSASNSLIQSIAGAPARLVGAFIPAPRAFAASDEVQGEDCDDPLNNIIEKNQLQTDPFCGLQFAAAVDVDDETETALRNNAMITGPEGQVAPGSEFQRYIDEYLSGQPACLYNRNVDKSGNTDSRATFKLDSGTEVNDPCISDGPPLPGDNKGRFLRYTGWYGYLNDENGFVEYINDDYGDGDFGASDGAALATPDQTGQVPSATGWVWPIADKGTRISQCWNNPSNGGRHAGIDIAVSGATVVAANDGIVAKTGSDPAAGNYMLIHHKVGSADLWSTYEHLAGFSVKQGDPVKAGQPVGTSGNTGNSTGPHLHFGVAVAETLGSYANNSQTRNPLDYLPKDGRNTGGCS